MRFSVFVQVRLTLILILSLVLGMNLTAQKISKREIESIMEGSDKWTNVTEVPEKWADHSAVIIYQEIEYFYSRASSKSVSKSISTRRRIKIQDRSSLEQFSELHFDAAGDFLVVVFKSGGSRIRIDKSDAVAVDVDGLQILKLAVGQLEIGDILDYLTIEESKYYFGNIKEASKPIISALPGPYPIMEQRIRVLTASGFNIRYKSYNGAPMIQPIENANAKQAYECVDANRSPHKAEIWDFDYRSQPTIKFQVLAMHSAHSTYNHLWRKMFEKQALEQNITTAQMQILLDLLIYHRPNNFQIPKYPVFEELHDDLDRMQLDNVAEEVEWIYNYCRYKLVVDEIRKYMLKSGSLITAINRYDMLDQDFHFLNNLCAQLAYRGIHYEYILAVPRSYGTIGDVLMTNEFVLLLKINLPEPIVVSRPGLYTVIGEIPNLLEGSEAYLFKLNEKNKIMPPTPIVLEASPCEANKVECNIDIRIKLEDNVCQVLVNRTVSGQLKDNYTQIYINLHDVFEIDDSLFKAEPSSKKVSKYLRDIRAEREKQMAAFRTEHAEDYLALQKEQVVFDFGVEGSNYKALVLHEQGRWSSSPSIQIEERFEIEDLLTRAGPNYVFNVGKLIGGQVALNEDERVRESDIHVNYARTYEYNITFEVPPGYSVEGLDELQTDVQNKTGGFVSTSTVNENIVQLSTKKYYTHNFESSANWPEMVLFLDAAYSFSQSKILFKLK